MEFNIKTYDPSYLETQVTLGNSIIKNWKFQSQSSLEHLEKVYAKDNFQPDMRLYAFNLENELIGFQTSHVLDQKEGRTIGRIEFPIVKDENWEVVEKLQQATEKAATQRNATHLRARVSQHWGKTEEYSQRYGFEFEKPHLATTSADLDKIKIIEHQKFNFISVDLKDEASISAFKEVFPQRFPMRYESELDSWIKYYDEKNPVIWVVLIDNEIPNGHIIGFAEDEVVKLTSFFSLGKDQGRKLQVILSYITSILDQRYKTLSLAIGDDQIPFIPDLEELGIEFDIQIAYHIKKL